MKKLLSMMLVLLFFIVLYGCAEKTTTKIVTLEYYEMTKTITIGQIPLEANDLISMISLGGTHSIALSSKGRVFSWGNNAKGQLGDGTSTRKLTPVEITNQFDLAEDEVISFITLGERHSAALTSKGRLFTWGWNFYGRLGNGTTTSSLFPIDITSHFNLHSNEVITEVSLGVSHSSAITSEGRVFTWGDNAGGQLGDGTLSNKSSPMDITAKLNLSSGEKAISISLGYVHSAVLTTEGRVFTWGNNTYGQLGNGTNNIQVNPVDITTHFSLSTGEKIKSINLGEYHGIAVTSNNRVFTWGNNLKGQLGDGSNVNQSTPTEITNQFNLTTNETIELMSLGISHSIVVTSEERVFAWGDNSNGQLGDGTNVNQSSPKDITSQFNLVSQEKFRLLSLGESHSTLLTTYGKIIIWGDNVDGKLGDNTTSDTLTPLEITFINTSPTLLKSENLNLNEVFYLYTPEMEGFIFEGWFEDQGLSIPFGSTVLNPTSNLSLYGEWILED